MLKIQWLASIWWQNDQNNAILRELSTMNSIDLMTKHSNAKLRKRSNYNDLHRFDDKTIKTTQNYENYRRWIASIWRQNDQKCLVTSQNIENNSKLQKYSNYDEFASIWSRNDKKYWLTLQTVQIKAKLQNWSKYNELHRLDVKTIKSKQSYKIDQSTMNCIEWMSKRSKQRKTPKVLKLQWIASIWCQNDQNNAKLQTRSNYDEFASIWRQNDQKCWVTSQNIQNNAKL